MENQALGSSTCVVYENDHLIITSKYLKYLRIFFSLNEINYSHVNEKIYLYKGKIMSFENLIKYILIQNFKTSQNYENFNIIYKIAHKLTQQLIQQVKYLHTIFQGFIQIDYKKIMILVPSSLDIADESLWKENNSSFPLDNKNNQDLIENIQFIYHDFENLYNFENNHFAINTPFSLSHFYDPYLSKITELPCSIPINCIIYSMCKLIFFMFHQYENAQKKIKIKFESLFDKENNEKKTLTIEEIIQFSNPEIQNAFTNTPLYNFLKHNLSCKMEERRLFL